MEARSPESVIGGISIDGSGKRQTGWVHEIRKKTESSPVKSAYGIAELSQPDIVAGSGKSTFMLHATCCFNGKLHVLAIVGMLQRIDSSQSRARPH